MLTDAGLDVTLSVSAHAVLLTLPAEVSIDAFTWATRPTIREILEPGCEVDVRADAKALTASFSDPPLIFKPIYRPLWGFWRDV